MALFNAFRSGSDKPQIANREALLARYKHLRQVSRELNNKLVQRLPMNVIHEGGSKLGLVQGNTFVFDTEDESSVLMDYCIYHVRRDGRNAFEKYLMTCSPDSESDEMACLRAMQRAIYSLFMVETVERGLGVTMRDMRTNEIHLVVDHGMGMSAAPGLIFATRLLFHDDFAVTGGAGLPIGKLPQDKRDELTEQLLTLVKPDDDGHFDPARLIRSCLRNGSSSRIRYLEATGMDGEPKRLLASERPAKLGPYEPCPCGSGKKFKFCCRNRG